MSDIDLGTPSWVTIGAAAERAGVDVGKVQQWLRDGLLVGRRGPDGVVVPAQFLSSEGTPVKGLPGVITLLRDARFSDEEIIEWLFRADESVPGTPIEALLANRSKEVKRRAQVAGY